MKSKNPALSKLFLLLGDAVFLAVLIFLDQFTKRLAVLHLKGKDPINIIPGALKLQYLENNGAAFGVLQNQKLFFVFIAVIILSVILYVLCKAPLWKKYRLLHVLLVMIAGGAIGNMIDRLTQTYVVDFIYFSLIDFPIFNVADIYVTCATIGLALAILFYYQENDFHFLSLKPQMTREPKYNKDQKK